MGKPEKELKIEEVLPELNMRQKYFCELFTFSKDFFGNAGRSYLTAYSLKEKQINAARVSAHHLLRNPNIKEYIDVLLKQMFKNANVDKELSKLVGQDKNLLAKLGGIQEYNKLQKRIKDKLEVTIKPDPIMGGIVGKKKVVA